MEAEPAQGSNAFIRPKLGEPFCADRRGAIIETCYELLSSGRSLSEVLDAARRLSSTNKASASDAGHPPAAQIDDLADEARLASSQPGNAQLTEPLEATLTGYSHTLGPDRYINVPRSCVGLKLQQTPENARHETGRSIKPSWLIGAALFWLIPTISLTIIGSSAKLLFDAEIGREVAAVTAILKAIPRTLQLDRYLPALTNAKVKNTAPATPILEASRAVQEIMREPPERMRAAEQDVTGSLAEPPVEAGGTGQSSIRDIASLGIGIRTLPTEFENEPLSEVNPIVPEVTLEQTRPPLASEQAVTGSVVESVAEVSTTVQASLQNHRAPNRATRPAALRSRSVLSRPRTRDGGDARRVFVRDHRRR